MHPVMEDALVGSIESASSGGVRYSLDGSDPKTADVATLVLAELRFIPLKVLFQFVSLQPLS